MAGKTDPETRARGHRRVRRQHSDELAQDYVEAIRDLNSNGETARVKDLQQIFGVSHVTVIRALERFEKRALIDRSAGSGINLTPKGKRMAAEAAGRHALVVDFLRALGVSENQAHADAEGLEHHFSDEAIEALRRFMENNTSQGA